MTRWIPRFAFSALLAGAAMITSGCEQKPARAPARDPQRAPGSLKAEAPSSPTAARAVTSEPATPPARGRASGGGCGGGRARAAAPAPQARRPAGPAVRRADGPLSPTRRFEGYARTVIHFTTDCSPGTPDVPPRSEVIRDAGAYETFAGAIIQPGALPEVKRQDPLGARPAVDFGQRMLVVALCELTGCRSLSIQSVRVVKGEVVVQGTRQKRARPEDEGRSGHFAYQAVEVPRHDGPVRFVLTDR